MRGRAYRRHQEQRKKNKVSKYWVLHRYGWLNSKLTGAMQILPGPDYFSKDPAVIGCVAHTPAACSCMICGNPRKNFGELTIQERRAFQDNIWEEAA